MTPRPRRTPIPRRTLADRRYRLSPLVAQAGGVIVIVAAVFTLVRGADRLQTAVENLTGSVGALQQKTDNLVISTTGVTTTVTEMQAHLRQIDAQILGNAVANRQRNERLDVIEQYLLLHGPRFNLHHMPADSLEQ